GIGIVPAPGSLALVPNRSLLGSLLGRVIVVATLGAPVNVTCAATSRLWPTVTLGAETAPPETLAVMPLAPAAGVLKPVGGVAESVVAPTVRAVNVVVYAVSAGVNVTEAGLTLPTVVFELDKGTATEKPPRSPWFSWYTNVVGSSRPVMTVKGVVFPTLVGKLATPTTPVGPVITKPEGVSVTVPEPLV